MSLTDNVRVTVLLPVYNAERYLREAVDSIFSQTFADFELLAIDDGSVDGSLAILKSYDDPRLRIVRHQQNLGLIAALNEGLEAATGQYIARMDADDISLPQRLARQVEFLDANPAVGICGAWAQCFDGYSKALHHPTDAEAIRCFLLFDSALVHPTVMFRAGLVRKHGLKYGGYPHAEDLALWREATDLFPTANVPEVLLKYRVHPASVTGNSINRSTIAGSLRLSDQQLLGRLGVLASDDELDLHARIRIGGDLPLDDVEAWLVKLRKTNATSGYYPQKVLDATLSRRWFLACYAAKGWGVAKWRRLRSSTLFDPDVATKIDLLKFALRVRP